MDGAVAEVHLCQTNGCLQESNVLIAGKMFFGTEEKSLLYIILDGNILLIVVYVSTSD